MIFFLSVTKIRVIVRVPTEINTMDTDRSFNCRQSIADRPHWHRTINWPESTGELFSANILVTRSNVTDFDTVDISNGLVSLACDDPWCEVFVLLVVITNFTTFLKNLVSIHQYNISGQPQAFLIYTIKVYFGC